MNGNGNGNGKPQGELPNLLLGAFFFSLFFFGFFGGIEYTLLLAAAYAVFGAGMAVFGLILNPEDDNLASQGLTVFAVSAIAAIALYLLIPTVKSPGFAQLLQTLAASAAKLFA